ncbi:hypothetical protein ABZT04_39235 [Streptomyces sp. NPDC005492]|uniref:nSTAND3 domain-containing NTPase n=1 Tax=Streptomyces sp. NPDC005492 TaxID=3156883 RepID=UPI0033BE3D79
MSSPDYDFKELSPYGFEVLTRDLLSRNEDISYSTYAIGRDGGIDLRARTRSGVRIAQCKHTPDAKIGRLIAYAKKEKEKLLSLGSPIRHYSFITTAELSPLLEDRLLTTLAGVAEEVEVHGRGWLNSILSRHSDLERRHFKLWLRSSMAIHEMLRGGVFLRGESRVRRIQRNYLRFVHHDACDRAEEALESTGIAVISGSPGAGKTATAEYLLLQWWHRGYRVIVDPRTVDSWWEWLEDDVPTIFFFDDAWGQTQLHDHRASHYDRDFAEFLASIVEKCTDSRSEKSREKVAVITTRSLVLHDLLRTSDSANLIFENISESVVRVERLPSEVRARILFNHINAAIDDQKIRAELAAGNWWDSVSLHANYSPRIVELVTARRGFTSGRQVVDALKEALNDPHQIWQRSFIALSTFEQFLLSVLAVSDSRGVDRDQIVRRLKTHPVTELKNAIGRLVGSWIDRSFVAKVELLNVTDPSQRDFLVNHLSREPLACLDVIRNSATIEDLSIMCERGRPPEVVEQPTLFTLDEVSLRESLDGCAVSLVKALRQLWTHKLDEVRGDFRDPLPENLFVEAFETLARVLIYQIDRYAAPDMDAHELEFWFEASMPNLFSLLDRVEVESYADILDALSRMLRVIVDLTRHRVFPRPYGDIVHGLRLAMVQVWGEWEGQVASRVTEVQLVDDIYDAVISHPEIFSELGFTEYAESCLDIESLDVELTARIEDIPFEFDVTVGVLEDLFGCTFPEARKALKSWEDTEEPYVPDEPLFPIVDASDNVRREVVIQRSSMDVLFNSLADPIDVEGVSDEPSR